MGTRHAALAVIGATAAAAAALALLGVGRGGPQTLVSVLAAPTDDLVTATPLTTAGPLLDFDSGAGWVTATAGANVTQHDLREVFWYRDTPIELNEETCATWTVADGPIVQQGAALRIATLDGIRRAITVTRNIFGGATWVFNVHLWVGAKFTLIGQVNLGRELGIGSSVRALPWRFCARAIDQTVEFKVWPLDEAEPAWGDGTHGGAVLLPPGWVYPGVAGWYAGHLSAGDRAGYRNLIVTALRQDRHRGSRPRPA
jgi:hypothetical protein